MTERMKDEPQAEDLAKRTRRFAVRIIGMYSRLPNRAEAQVIGNQILRSGTSVRAQYREARRARSNAEFISKLESALQELDETAYWLEVLIEAALVPAKKLESLQREADELTAILVSIVRKVKRNR